VNFREGEICIVYPRNDENDTVLNRQILKGTLVQINNERVEVRFRYKQKTVTFLRITLCGLLNMIPWIALTTVCSRASFLSSKHQNKKEIFYWV